MQERPIWGLGVVVGWVGLCLVAWWMATPPLPARGQLIEGYAGRIFTLWDSTDIFTDSTDTTLSTAIFVEQSQNWGVWYQAISAVGTPNIAIEPLVSYDNTASRYVLPDTTVSLRYSGGWAEVVTQAIEDSLKDETAHYKVMSYKPIRWLKIRVRGRATNRPDTRVRVILFTQPPGR